MNIVVCVKQVPDTAAERKLRSGDGTLDRAAVVGDLFQVVPQLLDEIGKR
jgi:electron transfer flavoprotein beta subunit